LPRSAGTTLETRPAAGASAAIGTSATAVGTATPAIRASATAVAAAVTSAATERPLEARTRIAADAGRVARELFTRSRWPANARGASFAGEENHVFFDDGCAFGDGFAACRRDQFLFDMPDIGVLALDMFMLAVLVLTMRRVVFGMFLSHVRGEFRTVGRAPSFDFLDFFLGEFRDFGGRCFFRFFRFGSLFGLFFVEFGAADDGIGFRFFLRLLVFGLDETGSERGDLIFVQFSVIAGGLGIVASPLLR
jgi:hypothetical protein